MWLRSLGLYRRGTSLREINKIILTVLVALAIAATTATSAEARGYRCTYSGRGVFFVFDGFDNTPTTCHMWNSIFRGRRVYSSSGSVYCAWIRKNKHEDVRMTLKSTSSFIGHAWCKQLQVAITKDGIWKRVK